MFKPQRAFEVVTPALERVISLYIYILALYEEKSMIFGTGPFGPIIDLCLSSLRRGHSNLQFYQFYPRKDIGDIR